MGSRATRGFEQNMRRSSDHAPYEAPSCYGSTQCVRAPLLLNSPLSVACWRLVFRGNRQRSPESLSLSGLVMYSGISSAAGKGEDVPNVPCGCKYFHPAPASCTEKYMPRETPLRQQDRSGEGAKLSPPCIRPQRGSQPRQKPAKWGGAF